MNPSTWNWAAIARWAGTAAMGALVSLAVYYPAQHWIPIATGILATLGFHVVPSGAQSAALAMARRAFPLRPVPQNTIPVTEERQP